MQAVFDILTAAALAETFGKRWLASLLLEMGIGYQLLVLTRYHTAAEI